MDRRTFFKGTLYTLLLVMAFISLKSVMSKDNNSKKMTPNKTETLRLLHRKGEKAPSGVQHKRNKKKAELEVSSTEKMGSYDLQITQIKKANGGYKKIIKIGDIAEYSFETKPDENGKQKLTKCFYTNNKGETFNSLENNPPDKNLNYIFFQKENSSISIIISTDGRFILNSKEPEVRFLKSIAPEGNQFTETTTYFDAGDLLSLLMNNDNSRRNQTVSEETDINGEVLNRTEKNNDVDDNENPTEIVRKMDANHQMYIAEEKYTDKNGSEIQNTYNNHGQYLSRVVINEDGTMDISYFDEGIQILHQKATISSDGSLKTEYFGFAEQNYPPINNIIGEECKEGETLEPNPYIRLIRKYLEPEK